MEIDKTGHVVSYDIFPSFIKSRKKMTYSAVNDILMRDIVADGYEEYADTLKEMNELAHILRREKIGRGYIDFGIDEAKVICDENGRAKEIKRILREDGEKLIEDFMIAANETFASHIDNMDLPFIYRVHDIPSSEKLDDFIKFISVLGYQVNANLRNITPKTLQDILHQLEDKPEHMVLASQLLRSMRKAKYQMDFLWRN